tara:strand:+ start:726 stop:887 length:162 start_codon:yes stop_codon:yes gene_type:complete
MDELLKNEILNSFKSHYSNSKAAQLMVMLEQLSLEELDPTDLDYFLEQIIKED